MNGSLGLAHADRFDEDGVVAGRFAKNHRFTGLAGHAAEGSSRGRGADEGVWMDGKFLHAGLVAQNRTFGTLAGGVDGQHGQLVVVAAEVHAKGFDEGALASPRDACDAQTKRLA